MEHMPESVELWIGTLDEEVLIGAVAQGGENEGNGVREMKREGGWGTEIAKVKETLFWGKRIEGVTDGGGGGKKWWGMIGDGTPFN